jgi:Holliday junction resolvase RusA-like endonuclease
MSEESKIMWFIQNEFKYEPICVPITVIFNFYMPIPQSLSKKVHENDPHIKKPDIDNLVKMYLDAMNQMVFKDDSLIYRTSAIKVYSVSPRTVILIEE